VKLLVIAGQKCEAFMTAKFATFLLPAYDWMALKHKLLRLFVWVNGNIHHLRRLR
jgi:hypothetical protein